MRYNYAVHNLSVRDESRLVLANTMFQDSFQPISKNFGDDFVNNITEAKRSKMSQFSWYLELI